MFEYESEQILFPFNIVKPSDTSALSEYDNLLNKRASDGWELVTSTYLADVSRRIVVTFKREKA